MKYAYYREIHAKDLASIPYFYWWRSAVVLRAVNVWHDITCIANGSISIKGAIKCVLAIVLSPLLLLLSPLFSYEEQRVFKKDINNVYFNNIELFYVPKKFIKHSAPWEEVE